MTRATLRGLGLLGGAAFFLALGGMPVQAQTMTGDQIVRAWSDKPLTVTLANGSKTTVVFKADGAAAITGAASDTGRWNPIPTGYCTKWSRLNNREERCFTVTMTSPGKYEIKTPQGAPVSKAELQ